MNKLARHLSFDPPQRRIITILLGLLIAYGVTGLILNPVYIADPQPPTGDRSSELADRLDPNTASAADFAAIPGLGDARAKAIVTRRDTVLARDPTTVPFRSPDDLFYVPRFGRSMVEQAKPFLVFPATQAMQIAGDKNRTTP